VPVTLRPIRQDELAEWLAGARIEHAREMAADAGLDPDEARLKVTRDLEALFPNGEIASGHSVFVVETGGERVGSLWAGERPDPVGRPTFFVYDIRIDEGLRGRGYGRAAMIAAEAEATRRGIDRIALNVFGGNEHARSLYRSLGYVERAVAMDKTLTASRPSVDGERARG
jgi:ribosomal protein S18 acetylase RimI-like enzyme